MLRDVDTGRPLTKTPYQETFNLFSRMSPEEIDAARAAINLKIDAALGDKEILTAGWLPGNDWTDTAYHPIYEKAARRDYELAGRLFGLLVFEVFRERDEEWWTGRFELDGRAIESRTYFLAGGR